jgi:poly-gamma-glutamate synthesis protein (capsule biosynthesis protein)
MIRLILLLLALPAGLSAQEMSTIDIDAIRTAIVAERPDWDPPIGVTGITVPHHLAAPDLIARGFWAASAGEYDRIILLAPDHFRAVDTAFATSATALVTPMGRLTTDEAAVAGLLARMSLFGPHPDLASEHAVTALAPFLAYFFPGVPVVPVISSGHAQFTDMMAAVEALQPLAGPRTLIVQSTDFSHYLSEGAAALRDQETLALIAAGRAEDLPQLTQPGHLDALAAMVLQMALQSQHFGATAAVIGNRNSADYGGGTGRTTSYIVAAWHPDPTALSRLDYPDQTRIVLGGDTLLGRYLTPVIADAAALAPILQAIHEATGGARLVLNLEGVITDTPVPNAARNAHLMNADLALPILRYMGVAAAGLANNHAHDFGSEGAALTRGTLAEAGIIPLTNGSVTDLGDLRIVAFNMVPGPAPVFGTDAARFDLCNTAAPPPVIAFAHWGAEYTAISGPDEETLAASLADCGYSAVIGTHSHVASSQVRLASGRMPWVFSLGNLLFDQAKVREVSGALAEIRTFRQGTVALRLIPIPNFFETGRLLLDAGQ